MKNIEKIILLSILSVSVFKTDCVLDGSICLIKITKENAEAIKTMVQIGGNSLAASSKGLFSEGALAFAKSNVLVVKELVKVAEVSGPAAVAVSKGVGYKAIKEIAESNAKIAESITSVIGAHRPETQ